MRPFIGVSASCHEALERTEFAPCHVDMRPFWVVFVIQGRKVGGGGATRTVLFPETTVSFASSCPCLVQCLQFKSNI